MDGGCLRQGGYFAANYRSITAAPDMWPSRLDLDALRGGRVIG
jgi:hypothetical protein